MEQVVRKMEEAVQTIEEKIDVKPEVGLILGSGLGDLADEIEFPVKIKYSDIPHFPVSTVAGHAGQLVIGQLHGVNVLAMQGRFHFYEGYSMKEVTFPVRVMKGLGVETLVVTNACGGINASFQAGDLMVIEDHLNMTGTNPLIGPNDETLGPRFPDMSRAYDPELIGLAEKTADRLDISVQKGVYAGISGPSFMTPAELKMLRTLGADALGMSTVPEVIVANHTGVRVLGISCVTDMAIAEELEPLTHEQVVATADRTRPKFIKLVKEIVSGLKG
ncbi:MAG TPA: purine-nucleoside phosphorylase [Bacillales bacterium]|nr:purine-nucleoside phosphorylase [Bacillales bacterium]